uniref:Mop domain-containing protein n=1 Tax=Syphacia muris TaxID=451379 RepID=A0A0N5AAX0_9BILA
MSCPWLTATRGGKSKLRGNLQAQPIVGDIIVGDIRNSSNICIIEIISGDRKRSINIFVTSTVGSLVMELKLSKNLEVRDIIVELNLLVTPLRF